MSRKKRRLNWRQHKNIHHIFCQSTHPELRHAKWNQIRIDCKLHQQYHELFGNRTPEEVIAYLREYFWGGTIKGGLSDGTCQG